MNKEVVLGQLDISSLLKAQRSFSRALKEAKTELERDGVIQRFEFTYELIWKTLKRVLKIKGLDVNNPRDVFRVSSKEGLIDDTAIWFDFIKKRNLTVHTYNEDCAEEVFEVLPDFEKELLIVIDRIKNL